MSMDSSSQGTNTNIDSSSQATNTHVETKCSAGLPPLKRKAPYRSSSTVWDHFDKIPMEDGGKPEKCLCQYCKREFQCISSQGTSTLMRHLNKCAAYPHNQDQKQQLLSFAKSGEDTDSLKNWKFDQEACRQALARMIIKDEMPFKIVEHDGFQEFCKTMQPRFVLVSRTTVTKDCIEIYMSEKQKLHQILKGVKRVCLTTDMWTSNQNLGYMCLTAHYIDERWRLQKKILNFCMIPSPHGGEAIAQAIELCLMGWGIEKLCTLTVDNASSNDVTTNSLKKKYAKKGGLIVGGEYFHVRCCAHILNLIVKDGIEEVKSSMHRIRHFVRYIRSSPARLQQFNICAEQEKLVNMGSLILDVTTRWNSTFSMLESAIKFQKAFERLEEQNSNIVRELKDGPPTEEDWKIANSLCKFLKTFYDVTKRLSGSLYVTSNTYFVEVFKIAKLLDEWSKSSEPLFHSMTLKMKDKFNKYWESIEKVNMLLVIATVLDPRYKLKYVRFCYSRFYPSGKVMEIIQQVRDALDFLFMEYEALYPYTGPSVTTSESTITVDDNVDHAPDLDYESFLAAEEVSDTTSEVDRYLDEAIVKDTPQFDILVWWSFTNKYRILSHIAKDILAIPVSTVASESAFSTGGRVLDQFRSSLTPKIVETLICAQDWLRTSRRPVEVEENLNELEEQFGGDAKEGSGSQSTPLSVS